jgi:hypothetical protein
MFQLNFSEITVPILLLWGIGLGAFIVGMSLGYVSSKLRASEKIQAAEERVEVLRAEAERKLAEAEALKSQTPKVVDDPGLLRLKNRDGRPSLEMNGMVLDVKNVSPDQKKRLIELLSVIRPWIEGGQAVAPAQVTMPPLVASQPMSQPVSSSERVPVQKAAAPPTPSSTQPLPITKALSEKDFKALSIIAQIDHVFQSRILGTPYEPLGIRIFEGAVGSVEVMVGLNRYPSIDDVPDAEIKKAIRAAIAEWEEKYAPGP